METCICDISALRFWRTPPVVRLLATSQEYGTAWESLIDEAQATSLHTSLLEELPTCRSFATGPQWRHAKGHAQNLRNSFLLFAPSLDAPIDILVTTSAERRKSSLITPRLWSGDIAAESIVPIADGLCVASPAFALQQVIARVGLVRGLMMASELCGSFAVYEPPRCFSSLLEGLINSPDPLVARKAHKALRQQGGWEPLIESNRLTGLWSRPALLEPHELERISETGGSARGRATSLKVASLVKPGAASPLEAQAGILLGLSRRLGGEGFLDFEFNKRISLSPAAKLLGGKAECYCDLFFENSGLDIECQGKLVHDNESSFISDFNRSAALEEMGINVLFASHEILSSPRRFDAFAGLVAKKLNIARPKQTDTHAKAATKLRAELFSDWRRLF